MADASTALYSTSPSPVPRNRGSHRVVGILHRGAGCGAVEFFCEEAEEVKPRSHSLDACSLCWRPLARSRDIFMYRGDTPFCSEECRQEQIELDLARGEEEANYRRRSSRVRPSFSAAVASPAGAVPASY